MNSLPRFDYALILSIFCNLISLTIGALLIFVSAISIWHHNRKWLSARNTAQYQPWIIRFSPKSCANVYHFLWKIVWLALLYLHEAEINCGPCHMGLLICKFDFRNSLLKCMNETRQLSNRTCHEWSKPGICYGLSNRHFCISQPTNSSEVCRLYLLPLLWETWRATLEWWNLHSAFLWLYSKMDWSPKISQTG